MRWLAASILEDLNPRLEAVHGGSPPLKSQTAEVLAVSITRRGEAKVGLSWLSTFSQPQSRRSNMSLPFLEDVHFPWWFLLLG